MKLFYLLARKGVCVCVETWEYLMTKAYLFKEDLKSVQSAMQFSFPMIMLKELSISASLLSLPLSLWLVVLFGPTKRSHSVWWIL